MTAFTNALISLLSLYGIGARHASRRRRAPVQIGSPGKKRFMIEPITVATSSCGTTTKTLNSPM